MKTMQNLESRLGSFAISKVNPRRGCWVTDPPTIWPEQLSSEKTLRTQPTNVGFKGNLALSRYCQSARWDHAKNEPQSTSVFIP
jgi:hypothetical protein